MVNIGWITTRFLDLSETFIYEPLQLIDKYSVSVYAWQRRNKKVFPYPKVHTWEDQKNKILTDINSFLNNFGAEKILSKVMIKNKIELLHAHYGYIGYSSLQYKHKIKIPLVTSFYGLDVYQHTRNYFYRKQLQKLFREGDIFTVCSQKMRDDLILLGAPPSKIRVLYGGADLTKFKFQFNPYDAHKEINILMCGRFVEKKGFEYGIRAFLEIAKHNDKLKLKIIGSGRAEEWLKNIVNSSPFGNQVIFLGNKDHSQYIEELKNCHIFMSPSVTASTGDKEGLPTVLIEAAAIGRPLIATRHSGIPEIVVDGSNGLLVAERDVIGLSKAITRLLNENYKWQTYAQNGRELVESRFDLHKQVNILQDIYKELLA